MLVDMSDTNNQQYLLHVCCAPCATASVERLLQRGEQVTLFFSNSNIYPYQEYRKRLDEVYRLAERYDLPVIEDEYDHQSWLDAIAGTEQEKEKGGRCTLCFGYSLRRTYEAAKRLGISRFSTTLSVSPHKNSKQIFAAAEGLEGFVQDDFKKRGGYARSIALSKAYDLYRQCYCGCEFSMRQEKKNA
jgi:predicted adenine nucleotide alpha hydrolase (AANH) superfamily ATPase